MDYYFEFFSTILLNSILMMIWIGTVLEIGQGVTHSAVVVEGQTVHHSVRRNDIGGSVLTDYLVIIAKEEEE